VAENIKIRLGDIGQEIRECLIKAQAEGMYKGQELKGGFNNPVVNDLIINKIDDPNVRGELFTATRNPLKIKKLFIIGLCGNNGVIDRDNIIYLKVVVEKLVKHNPELYKKLFGPLIEKYDCDYINEFKCGPLDI